MTEPEDTMQILDEWTATLAEALSIPMSSIDRDAVLGLAGTIAHGVVRPAAPLTTYLVGYAAGQAAQRGEPDAFERLTALARQLAESRTTS